MAATGTPWWRERAEAVVLAAAVPIIFIHLRYQPKFHVSAASTTIGVELSDLAVLAVVIAAIVAGMRRGWVPLRRGWPLWLAAAAYFIWVAVELAIPHGTAGYPTSTHAVTAAKFAEYALLAPAVALVIRGRADLRLVVLVFTAWSVLASAVGLVQFFGANIFVSGATGGRQLSFLGFHDFASLSAAVLLLGVGAIVSPRIALESRVAWTAAVSGCVGVILSAAIAAVIGIVLACAGLGLVLFSARSWNARRVAWAGVVVTLAVVGAIAMRGNDLGKYIGFLQTNKHEAHVETYAHRTVLAYIGYRIWRDHPVAGVGWEGSGDPSRFLRYVPAARRKFSSEPEIAFPSAQRRYGVQNFYVQHLADLGVIGLLLLASIFGAALALSWRTARGMGAAIAFVWTLLVVGLWLSEGIVAGLPLDGLMWITFGLAARG